MADDIQITVGVTGKKDILDLANAVTTLGKNSEKLAKQLESNRLTDAAYEKGLQQQIAALVKLKVPLESATKFIMGNAAATLKSIEADKASKAAKEALITSQKRADTAFALATQKEKEMAVIEKELLASRAKLDAATKQEATTLDQLKMKYQAGYAEMKLYAAEMEQLNLAEQKNVLTAKQLKVEQDKLSASFAAGTGIFATHVNQRKSYANRMGVVFQQAGYQAGDFFVQVQSGTSILTAFSQQATQMVGMMYLIPEAGMAAKISLASLGIAAEITMAQLTLGLSIAIPVITSLASMFIAVSSSGDKAAETTNELDQKIKSIIETLKEWTLAKKAAAAGMTVEEMFGVQNVDEAVKKVEAAKEALRKVTQGPVVSVGVFGAVPAGGYEASQEKQAIEKLIAAEKILADLRKKQSEEQIKNFASVKSGLQDELRLQETIKKFGEDSLQTEALKSTQKLMGIRAELDAQVKSFELTKAQADALYAYYKQLEEGSTTLKDQIGKAYLDALNLGKADVVSGIDKAAEAARILAERMGISLGAAQAMVNIASLADKGGQAFINSPGYDPSNTRIGATGNQDVRSQMSGADWRQREWNALHPIPKKTKNGAVEGRIDTQEEYIAKLTREYDMKKKSLGLTDEQVKRTEFLFTLDEKLATMKTKRSELEIETEKQRAVAAYDAYAAAEKQAATMDMISSNLNDAFMSMVDGSQTVSGAFRNMMVSILKSVIEQTVTQPAANAISGLFKGIVSGITGSANGNIVGSSGIQAFAKGGVVSSPTMFKHGGGLGVMGEAGPEAIMPLKRGANGKLGVQVSGNNGDNGNSSITINNNINVVGSDAAMVRAEVTKMIPQITEASKVAVIDAKRRGGQMGAAFR